MEELLMSLSSGTVVGVGSFLAHNVIPQRWQFWAKDDNNIGRLVGKFFEKIAKDVISDGELDGDTRTES